MLNHPVTSLTNASTWRHADLMVEAERERRVALCAAPVRETFWSALRRSLRTEWRIHEIQHAVYRSLARVGR